MQDLSTLVDEIAAAGNGVVMTMGKGGVGKTTVAAAIAVALVQRGHSVHLSTTDPAAYVAEALAGGLPGLTIGKIDPAAETEAYRQQVLTTTGTQMDEAGRALLEEDLPHPAPRKLPSSVPSLAKSVRVPGALSCSIPRRPATRYCCSIPARHITASSTARRDPRSLRKFFGCSSACVIPSSRASCL